jgi:heat shock protein HtpX
MFKRVFLFVVVNILVIMTISISLSLLGVAPYLTRQGLDYQSLLIFCAVIGFSGAFISLALSRFMAKMLLNVHVIDPDRPGTYEEQFLVDAVYRLSQAAGLRIMPEVGIYENPEVNAFATGPGRNHALVAVSSGLLARMDRNAIEGVLAHEVGHIRNGDMVTMTLLQGVINTFVMFFARVAAYVVTNFLQGNSEEERPSYFAHYIFTFIFEIFLSILGSVVVCYFSRRREFSADEDGALLAGKHKMIHALETLRATLNRVDASHQSLATFKISGGEALIKLFATHPDLEDRIARLKKLPS